MAPPVNLSSICLIRCGSYIHTCHVFFLFSFCFLFVFLKDTLSSHSHPHRTTCHDHEESSEVARGREGAGLVWGGERKGKKRRERKKRE